jgi:hypothetical protein
VAPNFSPNITRSQALGLPSALQLQPPLSALGDLPAANFKWLLQRLGVPAGELELRARDALYGAVLLPLCAALGAASAGALALLAPPAGELAGEPEEPPGGGGAGEWADDEGGALESDFI